MTPERTVLVVEDEPDLRSTLAEIISAEGYGAAEAENGLAALQWMRSHPPPGLILLDLMMPVMNGLRFREEQLKDPALAGVPAVVLTASHARIEEFPHLRFEQFIYKPIDLDVLLAVIARYCAGHRGEASPRP